jgi:hypothetical protein
MKPKIVCSFLACLALAFTLGVSARPQHVKSSEQLRLVGGISVPGNPLRFDISWVDQNTARYYLGEAGNAGVDVFDAANNLYLGRIGGFHGLAAAGDPCAGNQGMGPSGVVVTSNNQLWATDAHGTVKVFDLNGAKPPFTGVAPVATISTGAQCRADEIGFDPKDHVIVVGNPAEKPPYGTVISSDPPYAVLSKIPFPDARGFEQPLWDPELKGGRMLVTVPGNNGVGKIAVIDLRNPKAPIVETTYETPNCASGLVVGPSQHLLVGCGGGKPLIIVSALTGKILATAEGTRGADEVWYNAGDNRFYAPSGGAEPILSAIDAATGSVISTLPAGPGVHSVAAYRGNNHIFVPIAAPSEATPTDTCSATLGLPAKQGCIAVYAHEK